MITTFDSARNEFKALKNMVYLNWAGLGPIPGCAVNAVSDLLRDLYEWEEKSISEGMSSIDEDAKGQLAKLMNASTEEIAITGTNTSQGVQTAFQAIQPKKGESIVTSDLQYVLSEAELQRWRDAGVEVRIVKNRKGEYDLEDFSAVIDDKTKVVFLDSVTWVNGYRFDIPSISGIAHEHGAYMVTDSIQHIGQVTLDTAKFGADMIAGGAQKWLSDWLGIGFFYVSKKVTEELDRPYYGYKNTKEPDGGWPTYFALGERKLFPEFTFYNDARKFEYGGSLHNMPGLVALNKTVGLINEVGIRRVQEKVLELKKELVESLQDMGFEVIPPTDRVYGSGITTFNTGLGRKADLGVVEHLNNSGFAISYRAGGGLEGIRVSTHYVNNSEDVEKLIEALKSAAS